MAFRLLCGLAAGCIIPLAMAYVGDVVPYEHRQQVLGRFLTGQISGLLFGQVAGGVLGDWFGWRNVFFILGGIFAAAAIALVAELAFSPRTRASSPRAQRQGGLIGEYASVLQFALGAFHHRLRVLRSRPALRGAVLHRCRPASALRFGLHDWSGSWSDFLPSAA